MRWTTAGVAAAAAVSMGVGAAQGPKPGSVLAELTWPEAEAALTPATIVVIPLGSAALQHGPHLKLDTDERLARYLAERARLSAPDVVIAPPLAYHFYPTYLEYPGSASLARTTARDLVVDIARSLAKYGPRRFYVLNTGTTTMFALQDAAEVMADQGLLLGYTDMRYRIDNARVPRQQTAVRGGAHADEIETSMMLLVEPAAVEMMKAVREYGEGSGPMTRHKDGAGTYSPSGILGDPTLATREKGRAFIDAAVAGVLEDLDLVRTTRLPLAKAAGPASPPVPAAAPRPAARPAEAASPNGCRPSDEREIRAVGDRFSYLWRQMDAEALSLLFAGDGDMRHPDGTIEKGRDVIRQNRQELFAKREFRGSAHPVSLNDIRCVNGSVAIADGKWELRMDDSPTAGALARNLGPGRRHAGWCTLVLVNGGGAWTIQAWRYTVNPPDGTPAPTTLRQPGFIGRGGD
jgi:creatinine amidohydrolase